MKDVSKWHLSLFNIFCMQMNYQKRGSGKPLLLIHGIGGSWRSWNTVIDDLAREREVIAVDLPGMEVPHL